MKIGETFIDDTFAEAFRTRFARLIVTADDEYWLHAAILEGTGNASSIIGCDCEAGIERLLSPDETPDGRTGAALLFFGFSNDGVAKAVSARTGQSLMTCPTTAIYDGLPEAEERIALGKHLRFFGDGFQKSKKIAGKRLWRIPVMDGEFLVPDKVGVGKGIGGGNLIILGTTTAQTLAAARRASEAIQECEGVIAPFPGGVVRSGSKVGSRYKTLSASTNDAYCPTLVGLTPSNLKEGASCSYEIVIDGIDEAAVAGAMKAGIEAAAGSGIPIITAGNYGGTLGKFHFHLRKLFG